MPVAAHGSRRGRGRHRRAGPAEHLEHPAGDHIAADHVHRGERGGCKGQDVSERVVRGHRDEHGAGQHDAVDRVGRRHQGRVQGGRHLADHLEAHQQGQHEDRYVSEQYRGHGVAPPGASAPGWDVASRAAVAGWMTAPSWVMTTPAWISSEGSMASAPPAVMCSSRALMLRARKADAAPGTVAARFPAPMMVTPFPVTIVWSGTEPATLPPSGPDPMSTTTEPAVIALSASSVISSGGLRPGTWAVVITTSCRAMWPASSACWACRSVSLRARA